MVCRRHEHELGHSSDAKRMVARDDPGIGFCPASRRCGVRPAAFCCLRRSPLYARGTSHDQTAHDTAVASRSRFSDCALLSAIHIICTTRAVRGDPRSPIPALEWRSCAFSVPHTSGPLALFYCGATPQCPPRYTFGISRLSHYGISLPLASSGSSGCFFTCHKRITYRTLNGRQAVGAGRNRTPHRSLPVIERRMEFEKAVSHGVLCSWHRNGNFLDISACRAAYRRPLPLFWCATAPEHSARHPTLFHWNAYFFHSSSARVASVPQWEYFHRQHNALSVKVAYRSSCKSMVCAIYHFLFGTSTFRVSRSRSRAICIQVQESRIIPRGFFHCVYRRVLRPLQIRGSLRSSPHTISRYSRWLCSSDPRESSRGSTRSHSTCSPSFRSSASFISLRAWRDASKCAHVGPREPKAGRQSTRVFFSLACAHAKSRRDGIAIY